MKIEYLTMVKTWGLLFLLGIAFNMLSARAQQTIFNVPSADITPEKQLYLEQESQFRPWTPNRYWYGTHYTAYGIGYNTEVDVTLYNVTSPPSDNITLGTGLKSVIPIFSKRFPEREFKITGGTQVLTSLQGHGVGNWTYGTLSGRLPKLKTRLSAGVSVATKQLFGRDTVHFIGAVEQPITKNFGLIADWYSGKHTIGALTAGFSYALPLSTTVFVGYQVPNPDNQNVFGRQGLTIELAKFF